LSQEKVLKTLESIGLTQFDARVYVFLAKRGPQKAKDIAKSLKMPKQTLYLIVKNLQRRGIITSTLEHPARFSVVPFEKILDLFIKSKIEEAQRMQQDKDEILSDWQSIAIAESDEVSARFTILEGRSIIYSKIQQMIQETEKQLSFVTTIPSLVRADQFGLFDAAFSHTLRQKIKFKVITDLSRQNITAMKMLLKKKPTANFSFEGRTPDLGLRLLPRMILKDEKEAIFFVDPKTEFGAQEDYACLWTNSKTLVNSFSAMFEDLWFNSTDIQKRITEIETGKPTPKTCVIAEAKTAKMKYDETLRLAKKEIVIMTSSKGLLALSKSLALLKDLTSRGVSIRVMASIVNENLEIVRQFKNHCEVRHVPDIYLGATTIDGQHFFQFKNPLSDSDDTESLDYFENTFYTNDAEYVRKTEKMLNDIWGNAHVPSTIALKAIIQQPLPSSKPASGDIFEEYKKELKKIVGFSYTMEPQQGTITEKEVLDKIANAVRIPARDPKRDILRIYGTQANAVIYPPKNLNLPNFLIFVSHNNRKSSFGAENYVHIYAQMKIAENEAYFPVAFVTDNPRGYKFRKAIRKIRPTSEVPYLLRKDELNVQIHGEKLIAGWTVPIPLLPPKYILPPACIMFEGYGKIKTYSSEMTGPNSPRLKHEFNMLDAFVTFMHPSSRYHGPGSDGILLRERILSSYPPGG
jgi:sugar-specific transcriptional regulator TrmB